MTWAGVTWAGVTWAGVTLGRLAGMQTALLLQWFFSGVGKAWATDKPTPVLEETCAPPVPCLASDRALVRVRQRPPLPAAVDAFRERRRESPRAEQRVGPFMLQSMLLAPARRWLAGLLVRSPFHLSPTRLGQAVAHVISGDLG